MKTHLHSLCFPTRWHLCFEPPLKTVSKDTPMLECMLTQQNVFITSFKYITCMPKSLTVLGLIFYWHVLMVQHFNLGLVRMIPVFSFTFPRGRAECRISLCKNKRACLNSVQENANVKGLAREGHGKCTHYPLLSACGI